MIEILMLDLGETLVHGEAPFPHVPEALQTITRFRTASGQPLAVCLVSDYTMPEPPTPEKVELLFQEYVQQLDAWGLTPFFQPVRERITLSTQVGVRKPDRRIFEASLRNTRRDAGLNQCLFVTENVAHIAACQRLGMKTLRFDAAGAPGSDFSDWSEAPLLIGRLVNPVA